MRSHCEAAGRGWTTSSPQSGRGSASTSRGQKQEKTRADSEFIFAHHNNEVEDKEESQAAGVAQEACRRFKAKTKTGMKTTHFQAVENKSEKAAAPSLPILGSMARGRTTHSVTRIRSHLPSSYQAFLLREERKKGEKPSGPELLFFFLS